MIELIAYPEKYDGKKVSVRGIINVGYESDRLFLTKEDREYYIIENSITWSEMSLDFPIEAKNTHEFYESFGDISGVHVEMAGIFRANEVASDGFSARGYLDDIKCIICNESYND